MSQIEHYCFEEHEEIRRAAVECLCNMVVNEEVCTFFLSFKLSYFSFVALLPILLSSFISLAFGHNRSPNKT